MERELDTDTGRKEVGSEGTRCVCVRVCVGGWVGEGRRGEWGGQEMEF